MIGKKLADRYELLERVGGGGMAVVYKAKDHLLDRLVAVKMLRPQFALDDDFVHRFRREAQSAASLSHPNIVSIYDVGEEQEIHYIVMEFVEGYTLKEYITKYAPLEISEAVQISLQIAEALEHAHQNKIIHRDIKPHNILIGRNMNIKVTDFGIARAVTSSTITYTGTVIGSVHYFSPEQARGGITAEKSDLYSLGVVLYEMLTGKLPYSADSPISVALMHLQDQYIEPRQINPAIPQSIENIIVRCLAKDPLQRYNSARELIADLSSSLNPERRNDAKVIIEEDFDEQATKIIPAINPDAFDTKIRNKRETLDQEDEWAEEDRPRRSLWLTFGFSLLLLLLLAVGVYQGFKFIGNLFYVPEVVVEDVTNKPVEKAIEILKAQNLNINHTTTKYSAEIAEGHVISQTPVGESTVKENTYVTLTVSLGKAKEVMPSLVSLPKETALRLIKDFNDHKIIEEHSADVMAGQVLRQSPEAEEMVIPDETTVLLYVSKGAEKVTMPNLIGKTFAEAEAELTKHKLLLDSPTETDYSDHPEGEVFHQEPYAANEEVEAGAKIKLWISKGYKELYREKIVEIPISIEEFEIAQISIFITDENGERRVVEEVIAEDKKYKLGVKVSREQEAVVKVFKNDELFEQREVNFD